MNIGIDLDGVVYDTENMFRAWSQIFDLKHEKTGILFPEELKVQKRYAWAQENMQKFLNESVLKVLKNATIMPFAKDVLRAIAKKNKIYLITSRGLVLKEEVELTLKRLKREKIFADSVIFSVKDKLEVCKSKNIDLMIEDSFENVEKLANGGINCLFYFDTVKKEFKKKNVTEVRNWGDIAVELEKRGLIDSKDIKIEL